MHEPAVPRVGPHEEERAASSGVQAAGEGRGGGEGGGGVMVVVEGIAFTRCPGEGQRGRCGEKSTACQEQGGGGVTCINMFHRGGYFLGTTGFSHFLDTTGVSHFLGTTGVSHFLGTTGVSHFLGTTGFPTF